MKYKALIVDVDGTLVGRDRTVSPLLHQAITRLQQDGIIFSIATGRRYEGFIQDLCKNLNLIHPIITYGGAKIVDPQTDTVLFAEYIPDEELKRLMSYLKRKNIYFSIVKGQHYTEDGGLMPFGGKMIPTQKLSEIELHDIPLLVVPASVAQLNEKRATELEQSITKEFKDFYCVKMFINGNYGLDITSLKATKHLAVLELMKLLHLKEQEVIGVGDGYNDYPLLTACGTKIAMGNAPEELKAIADFVAPTQEQDGLLTVINKFFK